MHVSIVLFLMVASISILDWVRGRHVYIWSGWSVDTVNSLFLIWQVVSSIRKC